MPGLECLSPAVSFDVDLPKSSSTKKSPAQVRAGPLQL